MTEVAGKAVYITGGSSGMGFAAGKKLAALGAHIAIFDRSAGGEALKQVEAARRKTDQRVAAYTLNVAERDAVLATMQHAQAEFGAPDIVIHMAGIGGAGELASMPFELFDRIMQVNVYGTRHVVEGVLPPMLARGSGKIVLVGSMGGIVLVFGYTAYGGSKFAVVGMAQCLRYELKPRGIRGGAGADPRHPQRRVPDHPGAEGQAHLLDAPHHAAVAVASITDAFVADALRWAK